MYMVHLTQLENYNIFKHMLKWEIKIKKTWKRSDKIYKEILENDLT